MSAFASSAAKPSSVSSSSSAFASATAENEGGGGGGGGGVGEQILLNKRNQLLRNRERRERLCNIQKNILAVLILSGAMFLILNVLAKMKEEIKARG
jgi:hypothetical protein